MDFPVVASDASVVPVSTGDLGGARPRLSAAPCVSSRSRFEVSGGCNINVLDLKPA